MKLTTDYHIIVLNKFAERVIRQDLTRVSSVQTCEKEILSGIMTEVECKVKARKNEILLVNR